MDPHDGFSNLPPPHDYLRFPLDYAHFGLLNWKLRRLNTVVEEHMVYAGFMRALLNSWVSFPDLPM